MGLLGYFNLSFESTLKYQSMSRKASPWDEEGFGTVVSHWGPSVVVMHLHDVHAAVKEDKRVFSEPWVYPAMSQLSACGVVASQLMPSWNCPCAIHLHPTQLQPIHEILRRSNIGNMETKRQNLKRALEEYLLEFNACRCGPCQNNGEPVLVGDTCFCQCRPGYRGPACEQTERRGKIPVCTHSRVGRRQQRDWVFPSTW